MFSSLLSSSVASNEENNLSDTDNQNTELSSTQHIDENHKEFMKELISEIENIGIGDLNNVEEDAEITAFLNKCQIEKVYKQLLIYPQIKNHPLFIKMYEEFINESDCVEYLISGSHLRFGRYGNGEFLSDLWDKESIHLDKNWNDIEMIILVDNFTRVEHVIKNPKNIEDLMESFLVNKYLEPSLMGRFMGFNSNSWDHSVCIYTKNYIYCSGGYSENYSKNFNYKSVVLKIEPETCNIINRNVFNIIRRNPQAFEF